MRRLTQLIATTLILATPAWVHADGGWETQTIDLDTGWNLVWLEVEPPDTANDPASVFGPQATSVCLFIAGLGQGDRGAWRCYHANEPAFVSNLVEVQGDRGYFVLAASDTQIAVTGRPLRRSRPIAGETPALFGAAVDFPAARFADYFVISDAIDRLDEINRFDAVGDDFMPISKLTTIDPSVAYWLTTDVDQDYAGPIRLNTSAEGLQFGKSSYALDLEIEVPIDDVARDVTIDALPSATPPAGKPTDAGAGDTSWLQYRDDAGDWQSFPVTLTIPADETRLTLLLRADRKDQAEACIDTTGSLYQALIEITDEAGHREVIGAGMEVLDQNGTWVGDVTLDAVSLNSNLTPDPAYPDGKAEPMRFGLLLEIPESGTPRILDKVCLAVGATYNPDGSVASYDRFTTFRSVMFPEVVPLDGSYDGVFSLAADHPLNPYRHRYNPEHTTGYAVTRTIDIEITPEDPAPENLFLGDILSERAGNNVLVGTYTEVITGLSAEAITVSGTFRLVRLSDEIGLDECPQ